MRCYIFDLDGTVCDISHRLHYIREPVPPAYASKDFKPDWDSFYAACVGDKPIEPICKLVRDLHRDTDIVFASSGSDAVRAQTRNWLHVNVMSSLNRSHLFMRKDGDHREDHIVKAEMLDEMLARGWQPIMAFDDRKQVVDMWRSRGIVCAQVAEGNF